MQLINIATNSIALFGFSYFLIALACHLSYRWQHPIVAEVIAPAVELELPAPLLLSAAEEVHPWEVAVEKQLVTKPIVALHQPAAKLEPSAELLDVKELLETINVPAPSEFAQMTIRELKRIASDRKISGYSRMNKTELLSQLT